MGKGGVVTWFPAKAQDNIRARLVQATEVASAEGADRAREIAPLGKGEHRATGANPRFLSIRLQTTHEFNRATKRGNFTRRQQVERGHRLARLQDLRGLNRRELVAEVQQSDVEFFRFRDRRHTDEATGVTYRTHGEQPDFLDVRPARGPGGEAVRGAHTGHTPGRLRKGIHALQVKVKGHQVSGGYASEAPYSNIVEKGFHHKGGTEVAGKHFMRESAENLRARWNSGSFLKE